METSNSTDQIAKNHPMTNNREGILPAPLLRLFSRINKRLIKLIDLAKSLGYEFHDSEYKTMVVEFTGTVVAGVGAKTMEIIPGLKGLVAKIDPTHGAATSRDAFSKVNPLSSNETCLDEKTAGRTIIVEISDSYDVPYYKMDGLAAMLAEGKLTEEEFCIARDYYRSNV